MNKYLEKIAGFERSMPNLLNRINQVDRGLTNRFNKLKNSGIDHMQILEKTRKPYKKFEALNHQWLTGARKLLD